MVSGGADSVYLPPKTHSKTIAFRASLQTSMDSELSVFFSDQNSILMSIPWTEYFHLCCWCPCSFMGFAFGSSSRNQFLMNMLCVSPCQLHVSCSGREDNAHHQRQSATDPSGVSSSVSRRHCKRRLSCWTMRL